MTWQTANAAHKRAEAAHRRAAETHARAADLYRRLDKPSREARELELVDRELAGAETEQRRQLAPPLEPAPEHPAVG
jgi:hypothetical protein